MKTKLIEGIMCQNESVLITGINPGELYMAKRNTGWQLECYKVVEE